MPNAGRQPLPEAGAMEERTLEAVGWTPWLGDLFSIKLYWDALDDRQW